MNIPYATALESDLQRLFIQYRPTHVMAAWNKILADFRSALQETIPTPPTITLTNTIIEPVIGPVEQKSTPVEQKSTPSSPDKDAQKAKLIAHREVVQKKHDELVAQGVTPEAQLTEENLRKWIQEESKSYWVIAEMTGCADNDISHLAKSKGIMSPIAMIIRNRRMKK
jgi:hypothetical protein